MGKLFGGLIGSVIGIFSKKSEAKNRLKQVLLDGKIRMEEAKINSKIKRIETDSDSDNEMDRMTIENMRNSWKDEFLIITFLFPVFIILCVSPFIVAYHSGKWIDLISYFQDSINVLDTFPDWYKWAIGLIFVAVLGFRRLLTKITNRKLNLKN